MDNLSAAYIDHTIYVAGGNENGKPGHSFYSMKLNKNLDGNWEKLPDFPGQTRLQPVLAAQQSADGVRIYLSSGFQPVSKDAYGKDVDAIVSSDMLSYQKLDYGD